MMLKKTSCKSLKTIAAVAFCTASLAVSGEEAAAFTWPESGTAVIPKGVTVVVTDADYDKVNALASIEIEEGATNIFHTSKAPTTLLTGYGAWVKRGVRIGRCPRSRRRSTEVS